VVGYKVSVKSAVFLWTEPAAQDELTETAAPVPPLYAPAPEAAPEETRAPKRGRKPKTLAEVAAPEVTTQKTPAGKRGPKPKAVIETANPEAAPAERRTPKRGRHPKILAEVAAPEVTIQETRTRKRGPKQITLSGVEAAPEAPTQKTQTRKPRQEQKASNATQNPSKTSLLAQLASVNAQLERLRTTKMPKVVEEIQQLMREYDLSIEDIDLLDQGSIGWGKRVFVQADVVLEPSAAVPTKFKRPARHRELVASDTGSSPGRVRCQTAQGVSVELKHFAIDRHGVLDAHDKLHVQRVDDFAGLLHGDRLEDHRQVERLNFWLDAIGLHFFGKPVDEVGWVVVNARGEVNRTGCERSHIGSQ